MAEEIQIKIGVNANEANQTVGQLKNNLEGVDNAQKKVSDSSNKVNQNLKNTSASIKNLGLEGASRGIEKMASGFSNLKLSNIAGGFRMVGAAIAANPIGAIATAVLTLVNAFGGLDIIIKSVTGAFKSALGPLGSFFGGMEEGGEVVDYTKNSLNNFNDALFNLGLQQKRTRIEITTTLEAMKLQGATAEAIAKKEFELEEKRTTDLFNLKTTYETRVTNLQKDIETQRAFRRVQLAHGDIEAANKIVEDIERLKDEVRNNKEEIKSIELEQFENTQKLSLKTLKIQEARNKDREKNLNDEKKRLAEEESARNEVFKKVQERYNQEVNDVNDFNSEKQNLLKEDLANNKITQEEYEQSKLQLSVDSNKALLEQNKNFQISEEEISKMGALNQLKINEVLSDDKIKINSAYYDALIAQNKDFDEKEKNRLEDEKKREQQRLEDEKRGLEARLKSFESDFLLKKIELLKNTNLKEEELDIALQEAELENLRNRITAYEIGSEEYFKLLEEITQKEVDINKQKNKKISDDNRETQKLSLDFAVASLSAISTFTDIAFEEKKRKTKEGSKEEEALARRQFQINKSLQLGTAVINGIQSILAITSVPDFTFGVQSALRIGAQVVLNAASIAKIAAQRFQPNASSASMPSTPTTSGAGAAPQTPTFTPTSFFGLGQTTQFNPQEQGPTRVYVTEGDISNTQNRVRVVENRARFG